MVDLCVYVVKGIWTNELKVIKGIIVEKEFEMSVTELVDYGYIVVFIYRSPITNFGLFLKH